MRRDILAAAAVLLLGLGEARAQQFSLPSPQPPAGPIAQFPMSVPAPAPAPSAAVPVQATFGPGELDPRIQAQVEKLVTERLKAEADKKAKADEEKKKADDEKKKQDQAQGVAVGSNLTGVTGSWRNGFWFETPNKDFTFHAGATFQYDVGFFNASDRVQFGPGGVGEIADGVAPRRTRLRFEATMWENMDSVIEVEAFNNTFSGTPVTGKAVIDPQNARLNFFAPGPTDMWMRFKNLPVIGNIRIGSQKEPISFERMNPYWQLSFMERSYLQDAFEGEKFVFAPGAVAYNNWAGDRGTWWLGVFKNIDNFYSFGTGDSNWAYDARVTYLPIDIDDSHLFHLGAAGSHRDPTHGFIQERVRGEIRPNPPALLNLFANTGNVQGGPQNLVYLEAAAIMGRHSFTAEMTQSWLQDAIAPSGAKVGTFSTMGAYAEYLVFLTPDHKTYDRTNAAMARVIPTTPFYFLNGERGLCRGWGAWEIGARYTYLDLTSSGINGGILQDVTFGINWYLNTNMRMQFNYDITHRGSTGTPSDGNIQALGMRVQVGF